MKAIKSYTDLQQSKKLSEILRLETADMHYTKDYDGSWFVGLDAYSSIKLPKYATNNVEDYLLPCWSLAALLNYLRDINFFPNIEVDEDSVTMSIDYFEDEDAMLLTPMHNITTKAETFIDACYKLILKLNELKML